MSGVCGCNSEVSAMRESTVYVREIQACLLKKMLNVRSGLSVIVRENRAEAKDRGRRSVHGSANPFFKISVPC